MKFRKVLVPFAVFTLIATACGGDDDDSAAEEPATEEPATEEPATEEPATEEPATEEPATEEPATEEPATEEPATEEPATEEPAGERGEFVLASSELREGFDPILDGASIKYKLGPIFDPLIGVDLDGNPVPEGGLAESWEYSADGTALTVTLREGITFSNGDPLGSEDVKFTLERVLSEDSVTSWAATMRNQIASIEVVDPLTVQINFTSPSPLFHFFLTRLDGQEGMITSKAYFDSGGDFVNEPIGTGPYVLESVEAGGASIVYAARDDYWGGTPTYDRLIFNAVPESSTRINQLRAGEADWIDVPRDLADSVEGEGFNIIASPVTSHIELWLLNQWEPPFDDIRVREAMNIAIDRQAIIDTIFQGRAALPNFYPMMTSSVGYTGPADIPYDPDRARQLIEEAGATGETVTIQNYPLAGITEAPQMLQAVAAMWDEIGLNTEIAVAEYTTVRNAMGEHDDSLAGNVAWMRDAPLKFPAPGMRILMHTDGLLTLHTDPQMDALVEDVESATDEEAYAAAVQAATAYVAENWLRNPMVEVEQLFAGNPEKVPADYDMGRYTSDVYVQDLIVETDT